MAMEQQINTTQSPDFTHRQSSFVNWLSIVVFLIVFAAFFPALKHGFVDWDDPDNFLRNPDYRGLGWENIKWMFSTFHMGHYQPLTWLTLGLDAVCSERFYGDSLDPRCYHFTNNLFHAINASLVFLIALRLIRCDSSLRTSRWTIALGAMTAALFFGIHPLRAESVAWITERRDLLSGFFILLSVLTYLRANRPGVSRRWFWLCLALILFALSLLSKVMGVTLPVVLLVLDWYPLRRLDPSPRTWLSLPSRNVLLEKIPFLALSIYFSKIAIIGQANNNWLVTLDMHGPAQRFGQACYGLVFYLWKTLAPTGLLPFYEMRFPLDLGEARIVISMLIVAVAALVTVILLIRCKWRALVAATLVYAVMLLPVLGFLQNGQQIVADRYSYLACIGWAIVIGACLAKLLESHQRSMIRTAILLLVPALIGVLAALTWKQTMIWRSTESLWTHMGESDPDNSRAQNGYGFVLLEAGRVDEAIEHLQRAINVLPTNDKAHENLWIALKKKGDQKALIAALDYSATIETIAARAHHQLARTYFQQGLDHLSHADYMSAEKSFAEVLRYEPRNALARTNVGWILNKEGKIIQALKQFEQAVQDDPTLFQARYNYGLVLETTGRIPEALIQYQVAGLLDPAHAGTHRALERLKNTPR